MDLKQIMYCTRKPVYPEWLAMCYEYKILIHFSRGFLQRQLCQSQLFCQKFNCWFVDSYFFYKIFFFRLKPKQYKKCQLFKKTIWKLIKNKVNFYNQQLIFWLNNWRSRKPPLMGFCLGLRAYQAVNKELNFFKGVNEK